jgi:hypothetical protein
MKNLLFIVLSLLTFGLQAQVEIMPYTMATGTNIRYNPNTKILGIEEQYFDRELGFQLGIRLSKPMTRKVSFIGDLGVAHHKFRYKNRHVDLSSPLIIEEINHRYNAIALRAGLSYKMGKFKIGALTYGQYSANYENRALPLFQWRTDPFMFSMNNFDCGLSGIMSYDIKRFSALFRYDLGLAYQFTTQFTDELGNKGSSQNYKTSSFNLGIGYTFGKGCGDCPKFN